MNGLTDLDRANVRTKLAKGDTLTTFEQGQLLVMETEDALARGTKHYDKHGTPLTTVKDILVALGRDGEIIFEPAEN